MAADCQLLAEVTAICRESGRQQKRQLTILSTVSYITLLSKNQSTQRSISRSQTGRAEIPNRKNVKMLPR